jgi:hypothetical protein
VPPSWKSLPATHAWIDDTAGGAQRGRYSGGLLTLSAAGLVAMIIVLAFPQRDLVEHVPEPREPEITRS